VGEEGNSREGAKGSKKNVILEEEKES